MPRLTAGSHGRLEWLLVPAFPLSVAYLLAIRWQLAPPGFAPIIALALLPTAYILVVVAGGLGRGRAVRLALAALELAWCALGAAVVGTAIGLRSG